MKVHIGPYKNWIGPYQIADILGNFGVSEDTCHKVGEWLSGENKDSILSKLCQWVDQKRRRKIDIHIDEYDTWSMDSTLALIILPMLKQLRDTKHGSPTSMPAFRQTSDSLQVCFDFYSDGDQMACEAGHNQWCDLLNEMIWAFEQLQPEYDWEEQYWLTKPEIDLSDDVDTDEGTLIIPLKWKVEGECDWVGREAHSARIDAGLRLFGDHFRSLWD